MQQRPRSSIERQANEDLQSLSDWDMACQYHELKRQASPSRQDRIRQIAIDAILARARECIGSKLQSTYEQSELLGDTREAEIDLDETIENSAVLATPEIWIHVKKHRPTPLVLSVDTSLSMTGEKLALTAVAIAVVLIQFEEDPVGVVTFETRARLLKDPAEAVSIPRLLERFLDQSAQGYTHLEDGLRMSLSIVHEMARLRNNRPVSCLVLTDGKYTAGKDPAYLADRFPALWVLKLGSDQTSRPLCRELAEKGRGQLREVEDLESLPSAIAQISRTLVT